MTRGASASQPRRPTPDRARRVWQIVCVCHAVRPPGAKAPRNARRVEGGSPTIISSRNTKPVKLLSKARWVAREAAGMILIFTFESTCPPAFYLSRRETCPLAAEKDFVRPRPCLRGMVQRSDRQCSSGARRPSQEGLRRESFLAGAPRCESGLRNGNARKAEEAAVYDPNNGPNASWL
jgi:hypothetical protein